MSRTVTILSAPSNLGLKPPAAGKEPGVRRMPDVLKANGMVARLDAQDAGTVQPPPYAPAIDAETGVRNAHAIRRYTERLADRVQSLLGTDALLLVLGGDCSILPGAMLALRRRGAYGLVFIDGHRDFQTPATSATGGAAGMDLALVTGHGPDLLTRFDGFEALVREDAVVALGFRDVVPDAADGSRAIADTAITLLDLDTVRRLGPAGAAAAALTVVERSNVQGFWIHVDADVLDSEVMPAVDSPEPGGMTYDELKALLVPLLQDENVAGIEMTIFDPDRDPDGEIGRRFTNWIVDVLNKALNAA
jgi:arginase